MQAEDTPSAFFILTFFNNFIIKPFAHNLIYQIKHKEI
jgi:hypothetical protein